MNESLEQNNALLEQLLKEIKKLNERVNELENTNALIYGLLRRVALNDGAIGRKDFPEDAKQSL